MQGRPWDGSYENRDGFALRRSLPCRRFCPSKSRQHLIGVRIADRVRSDRKLTGRQARKCCAKKSSVRCQASFAARSS